MHPHRRELCYVITAANVESRSMNPNLTPRKNNRNASLVRGKHRWSSVAYQEPLAAVTPDFVLTRCDGDVSAIPVLFWVGVAHSTGRRVEIHPIASQGGTSRRHGNGVEELVSRLGARVSRICEVAQRMDSGVGRLCSTVSAIDAMLKSREEYKSGT